MSLLLRKSFRDLRRHPWQVLGLTLLVAVVTVLVAGGFRARCMLHHTRSSWYEELAMADLEIRFAPTHKGVAADALGIDGVRDAEERLLAEGLFEAEGRRPLPALVQVMPAAGPPRLNRWQLLEGRYPRADEHGAVLDRSAASAYGLALGDRVRVRFDEHERRLTVVGISITPEHILHPVHPEYAMPLRETVAVLGVAEAATKGIERADRVDSLLVRFAPGADPAAVEARLIETLPVSVAEVIPVARQPGHVFTEMIFETFDIYMPATASVLVVIALLLLIITLGRIVRRQRKHLGTLVAMGHGPVRLAASFALLSLVPVLLGTLLGAATHGAFARMLFGAYGHNVGFAPLRDPGPGIEVPLTAFVCLLVALAACLLPGLALVRGRPARLLKPAGWELVTRQQGPLVHVAAKLRDLLRLPLSVVLGLTNVFRRATATACAVVGLGAIFAVVLAFMLVHETHVEEVRSSVRRLGLDATVHFKEPVGEDIVAASAERAGGEAEPILARRVLMETPAGMVYRRVVCAQPGLWVGRLKVGHGRAFTTPDAAELLVDHWIADEQGLALGDEVTCYPYANAPEGITLRVVGILEGVSLGLAVMPLDTGRALFELPGLASGVQISSTRTEADLDRVLWDLPDVEAVFTMEGAAWQVEENFRGTHIVMRWLLGMAIGVAVLFLGVIAVLDAAERGPDLAVLQALGWRTVGCSCSASRRSSREADSPSCSRPASRPFSVGGCSTASPR